ncbi:MAG TPA: hypothetical protein VFL45_09090 [Gammaproteobacteria bacterium]|jgi:predicted lipoprotein with Yx(FWY)xxD motif|nr:hypothetical protein [Gammaproteobacteria bacterium]HET7588222.1 hypothetical protein [Gammaproteobacteria bacterium]
MRRISLLIPVLLAAGLAVAAPVDLGKSVKLTVSTKAPYGDYLTDVDGRSLYVFLADNRSRESKASNCYGPCTASWPPLNTADDPLAGPRVQTLKVGTMQRRNSHVQVTYNGWPLYYYAGDEKPGDTRGQDKHGFGAEWYLISPEGQIIEAE